MEEPRQEAGRSSEKQSMEEQPVRLWRRQWPARSCHANSILIKKTLKVLPCKPVNCRVLNWGAWGVCTSKTGMKVGDSEPGTKTREREVVREPKKGGAACPDLRETDECKGGLFPFL